jgi:hypothetical protein
MHVQYPLPSPPAQENAVFAAANPTFDPPPQLPTFDTIFVHTVLEHRGVGYQPSLTDYAQAFDLLQRYRQQCADNPREEDAWQPRVTEESLAALRAKAFVMFGVTKPSPAQWHKVHEALFDCLLRFERA